MPKTMVKTARQKNCKFKSRRLTTHNSWTYDPQLIDLRPTTHGLMTHNSWTYDMKVLSFLTVKAMSPDLSYYAVKILNFSPKCKKNKQKFPFST